MTCAIKKFLEKFPDGDLRRLGCVFHLYEHEVREFTSISLWSAMPLLCNCNAVRLWTVQVFLKRMRDNNIINMKRRMGRKEGGWMVYELNMQNKLVADLFSKYQAVRRGEVYVNGDGKGLVCKYELPLLRQYWCFHLSESRVPMTKLILSRRLMEILEKGENPSENFFGKPLFFHFQKQVEKDPIYQV